MKRSVLFSILVAVLIIVACKKKDDDSDNMKNSDEFEIILSVVSYDNNFSVVLLANDTLAEGYNRVYFDVTDNITDEPVTDANISLLPVMNMTTMQHAAPVENPAGVVNEYGYFEGAVVFIMPSNPDEGWVLDVVIQSATKTDTAHVVIPEVKAMDEPRIIRVMAPEDSTRYFISLVEPSSPAVGINQFEVTVHYRNNMMSFPPSSDVILEIEPEMPSMDHGSPNNEHPVHTTNGHYLGKVNFTMTGWWRVHLTMKKEGTVIADDLHFDIIF
jgi:hypothetical protein